MYESLVLHEKHLAKIVPTGAPKEVPLQTNLSKWYNGGTLHAQICRCLNEGCVNE